MAVAEQNDEISALISIFPEEVEVDEVDNIVRTSMTRDCGILLCTFHLPITYPDSSPPVLDVSGPVSEEEAAWAVQELSALYKPGEPVLYDCIQALRDRFCVEPTQLSSAGAQTHEASAAGQSLTASQATAVERLQVSERGGYTRHLHQSALDEELKAVALRIVSGEALTERRSTFQAHLCTDVCSVREVELVRAALLQKHAKIRSATHNIMAYRIFDERTQSYMQSCDDDGEAAAGGRLLFLLETINATNVVVIVSRWFGGILMGGQRFKEINHAAQRLLQEHGLDQRHNRQAQGGAKPPSSRGHKRS